MSTATGSPPSSPTPSQGSCPARPPGWSCGTVNTRGSRTGSGKGRRRDLRNLPSRAWNENAAWLEVILSAVDLVCWTKQICFADEPALARCEIAAFRYRVLHVAARITRGSRQLRLRIDKTWRWAVQIAEGFRRLRAAFG